MRYVQKKTKKMEQNYLGSTFKKKILVQRKYLSFNLKIILIK